MITNRFIQKIRFYFDELGIDARNGISYEEFQTKFIKTLNRCKELTDAIVAVVFYKYCSKKWKKIEKMFSKHLNRWQEYDFEEASNIETVDDESSQGVYYITNALTKNKEIFLTSKSFDDEVYSFKYKNKRFMIEDDSDYYIKYAKMNSDVMKLFNKDNTLLCDIVLSKSFDVFLEKNNSEYDLIIQNEDPENSFIGVFKKSYIDSLSDTDIIDFKNMVADIEWDLLNPKSDLGVARVNLYQEVDDISPILYFATATFLLYKSFKDSEKAKTFATMIGLNRLFGLNKK